MKTYITPLNFVWENMTLQVKDVNALLITADEVDSTNKSDFKKKSIYNM